MERRWTRGLFLIAALYDGILGVTFLVSPFGLFELQGIDPPNHAGYVQFPALLLLVFAWMFLRVAIDPVRHRDLILYGCGLKLAYCTTVFGHALYGQIPSVWLPWAWADLVFLALFVSAWRKLPARVAD